MSARRSVCLVAAVLVLASACTSDPQSTPADGVPTPLVSLPGAAEPVATLASGERLPDGCTGEAMARQTVAFVAGGRAWTIDPGGIRLSCLFKVGGAGPFTWGPQGDRVLLGGLEVRGLTGEAPNLQPTGARPAAFDWGHPIGLAIVYAGRAGTPEKRFMDDGRVEPLDELPRGRYLDVAYHPSGLALAFVVDRGGRQRIWLSTNEGLDPQPLVFSEGGTRFTSIAFTPDGEQLVWIAQHAGGYPQIHTMDLVDRTGFSDGWRGEIGQEASNVRIPPSGRLLAFDVGTGCADRVATFGLGPGASRPALTDADAPSTALGWLDVDTLLVGVGGCDERLDVVAVDAAGNTTPIVTSVDAAATRTITTSVPESVPAPPVDAEEQPPPEGVG